MSTTIETQSLRNIWDHDEYSKAGAKLDEFRDRRAELVQKRTEVWDRLADLGHEPAVADRARDLRNQALVKVATADGFRGRVHDLRKVLDKAKSCDPDGKSSRAFKDFQRQIKEAEKSAKQFARDADRLLRESTSVKASSGQVTTMSDKAARLLGRKGINTTADLEKTQGEFESLTNELAALDEAIAFQSSVVEEKRREAERDTKAALVPHHRDYVADIASAVEQLQAAISAESNFVEGFATGVSLDSQLSQFRFRVPGMGRRQFSDMLDEYLSRVELYLK